MPNNLRIKKSWETTRPILPRTPDRDRRRQRGIVSYGLRKGVKGLRQLKVGIVLGFVESFPIIHVWSPGPLKDLESAQSLGLRTFRPVLFVQDPRVGEGRMTQAVYVVECVRVPPPPL